MKKAVMILLLSGSMSLAGCHNAYTGDSEITEEKAKQLVLDKRARNDGTIELIASIETDDKYIIHWEIDPIEEGKDSVDKENGAIKRIESSVGTCEWR